MQDKEVEAVVLGYLKKRGWKQTETVLRSEAKLQSIDENAFLADLEDNVNVANYILFYNPSEATPERYQESYTAFREWIMNSALDMYRQELSTLLYPMFIHCYLDLVAKNFSTEAKAFLERNKKDHNDLHADEILNLQSVTIPENIQSNDTSATWRNNRYNITLCRFSFELVVGFLQEKKYMLLLSIMNQYMNIRVFSGQPNPAPLEDYHAITGKSDKELSVLNKKEIYWGLYEENVPKSKDTITTTTTTAPPTPATEEKVEEEKSEDSKTKTEPPQKKLKKETVPIKLPKSTLPLPKLSEAAEAEHLEDISKRISLSASSLPSICFYTLFHSHQNCNTIEIARDGSTVAGGFADSTVRIWDLKKKNFQGKVRKEDYTTLVGHSGPVYGASFSPDRNYLLTCSEDKTARLWSLQTRSNLVCYKGHNYPIWDIEFSPHGYFFVTASHDRTARLWATDHVFPLRIFSGHLSDVNCVKFHPNCNYVATGSTDKSLRLWDINSGQPVRIFTGHYGSITSMALSPDGKMLASAGDDNKIILWDLNTSKKMATFTGHKRTIWSLDFSAESSILASGSADETVKLWDVSGSGLTAINPAKMGEEEEEEEEAAEMAKKAEEAKKQSLNGKSEVSSEMLKSFSTKQTPVFKVAFTRRNLLLSAGPFAADD